MICGFVKLFVNRIGKSAVWKNVHHDRMCAGIVSTLFHVTYHYSTVYILWCLDYFLTFHYSANIENILNLFSLQTNLTAQHPC